MALTRLDRQRPVHDGAHREAVYVAAVSPDHRDGTAIATGLDRLPKRKWPVGLHASRVHGPVEGKHWSMPMSLHSDRIDAGVRTPAAGHLFQRVDDVGHFVVDRLGAGFVTRHLQAIGEAVDG